MRKQNQPLFTDEQLSELFHSYDYYPDLAEALGYKRYRPSVRKVLQKAVDRLGLDDSFYFKRKPNFSRKAKPSGKSKIAFVKARNNSCEICGLQEWLGKPAVFEIHHIDENPRNNEDGNLQLLCLQCHAQTPNWRVAKVRPEISIAQCKYCEAKISSEAVACRLHKHIDNPAPRKFEISKEELERLLDEMPMNKIGEMFGVNGNSIKKRAKLLGIETKNRRGYWQKVAAGKLNGPEV